MIREKVLDALLYGIAYFGISKFISYIYTLIKNRLRNSSTSNTKNFKNKEKYEPKILALLRNNTFKIVLVDINYYDVKDPYSNIIGKCELLKLDDHGRGIWITWAVGKILREERRERKTVYCESTNIPMNEEQGEFASPLGHLIEYKNIKDIDWQGTAENNLPHFYITKASFIKFYSASAYFRKNPYVTNFNIYHQVACEKDIIEDKKKYKMKNNREEPYNFMPSLFKYFSLIVCLY